MPKGDTPLKRQLDAQAQDLLVELGTAAMTVEEIMDKYGRDYSGVRALLKRAREFGRANGIVIDRPVSTDGFLYRARWEWDESQRPNWAVMLNDTFSRTSNLRSDMASYVSSAKAEGNDDLAEVLEDIHDLFKVTVKSIAKARLALR